MLLIFCSFGQKKRDSIPKHIHGLIFEQLGAAGFDWALGYEYVYENGIHSTGFSVGGGFKAYRRNVWSKKQGFTFNQFLGIHYSIGTWVGLRTSLNFSSQINPGAYTGFYNKDGESVTYPLIYSVDGDKIPGDPVRYWQLIPSLDIGPYFSLAKNKIYLYPKFSLGFVMKKSYWWVDNRYSDYWYPYGGVTVRFNLSELN